VAVVVALELQLVELAVTLVVVVAVVLTIIPIVVSIESGISLKAMPVPDGNDVYVAVDNDDAGSVCVGDGVEVELLELELSVGTT
jgi:hypothetical protein